MFRTKICGVTRESDVRAIARAGADAIGFQMSLGPRKLTLARARRLVKAVPSRLLCVGVFVDEPLSQVKKAVTYCGFDAVQLHGRESADYCGALKVPVIKVIRMKGPNTFRVFRTYPVAAFLLDTYNKNVPGGTGKTFQTTWARKAVLGLPAPVILAGGLTPENVQKAAERSGAFGVDVSSGVESGPGLKDPRKVSMFIRNARKAFRPIQGN
ncbi:MAG TPA: phosphoribosylanthranilate isomerase [bacterium]|nr:phosphoribosylanthranilate isomerase [bacterium]